MPRVDDTIAAIPHAERARIANRRRRFTALLISLIALPLLLFAPQLIGLRSFDQQGSAVLLSTDRRIAFDILRAGHLPLWNPYASGGGPLIGDGRIALFYPLSWLSFFITDPARANTLFAVLNFVVAAIGAAIFARRMRLSSPGIAVATIAFTLSGFLTSNVNQPSTMAAASLVPLVFWAAERLLERGDAKRTIGLALLAALQLISGDLIVWMCTVAALLIYTMARATRVRALASIVIGLALAAGLSAAQLLPWLATLSDTLTARGERGANVIRLLSIGVVGTALAIYASASQRERPRNLRTVALTVLAILGLCCAFMPRATCIASFALAMLAGIGAARVSHLARGIAIVVVAAVMIESGAFAIVFTRLEYQDRTRDLSPAIDFLKQQPEPFRVAYFGHAERQASFARNGIEVVAPLDPLRPASKAALLKADDDPFALLRPDANGLRLFDARFAVIEKGAGFEVDSAWPIAFEDANVSVLRNPAPFGRGYFPKQVVAGLVEDAMLGVVQSNVPANRIAVVAELDDGYAQMVSIVGENDAKLIRRSPSEVRFVPSRVSYAPYDPPASVTFTARSPNNLELETTTDRGRMLVLSEAHAPGWHLEEMAAEGSIDPSPIYRTNDAFRGLLVAPGTSKFRMFYRPNWLYLGVLVSLMSMAGCGLVALAPSSEKIAAAIRSANDWRRATFVEPFDLPAHAAQPWLATTLLSLVAMFLGIAIYQRDGAYTPVAAGLLAAACIAAIAAAFVSKLDRRSLRISSLGGVRPDVIVLSLAVALCFALLFAMFADTPTHRAYPICVGLVAIVAGTALAKHPPLGRWTIPLILLLHLAVGIAAIRELRAPAIDVYLFQRDAAEALLRGQNPYAMNYRNIYGQGSWVYAGDVQQNGRLLFGYPYMPLTLLFTTATQFLFGDYRYGQLVAFTMTGAMMAIGRPGRISLLAMIVLLFAPRSLFIITQGWTEPLQLLLLAATVFCAFRLPAALPMALGLLLVSKQYMLAAIVLVPLLPQTRGRSNALEGLRASNARSFVLWWSTIWRAAPVGAPVWALVGALVAAIVSLPMILIDARGFWRSAVALQFKQPFRFDALSFLVPMTGVTYDAAQHPHGAPIAGAAAIAFVALLFGVGVALWKTRPSPRAFAMGVMLMFLMFFAFNKQAFANYYFFVVGAALIAAAAAVDPESA